MIKFRIILPNGFTEFTDLESARAHRDSLYAGAVIQKISVKLVDSFIEIPQDDGSVTTENRPKEIETILEEL